MLGIERVTVKLLKSLRVDELTEIKDSLVDIAADGVISEDEKPELKEILEYLDELTKTISELRSIGIKVLNGEAGDGGA